MMDSHDLHCIECATAAYAVLIERAERNHGKHSSEVRGLKRGLKEYIAKIEKRGP